MMGFNGVLEILLIAIILWTVIQFTKKYRSNTPDMHLQQDLSVDKENALGILNKRFASGEISQFEYDRMKKDIL